MKKLLLFISPAALMTGCTYLGNVAKQASYKHLINGFSYGPHYKIHSRC